MLSPYALTRDGRICYQKVDRLLADLMLYFNRRPKTGHRSKIYEVPQAFIE